MVWLIQRLYICASARVFSHISLQKESSPLPTLFLDRWPSIIFLNLHNPHQAFSLLNSFNIILPSHSQCKQKTLGKRPQLHSVIYKIIYIFAHYSCFFSLLRRNFSILCMNIFYVVNPITLVLYLRPCLIIYQGICSFYLPNYISWQKGFYNIFYCHVNIDRISNDIPFFIPEISHFCSLIFSSSLMLGIYQNFF